MSQPAYTRDRIPLYRNETDSASISPAVRTYVGDAVQRVQGSRLVIVCSRLTEAAQALPVAHVPSMVFVNGHLQQQGTDYDATGGLLRWVSPDFALSEGDVVSLAYATE